MSIGLLSITVQGGRDLRGRFARVVDELARARREEMRDLGKEIVQTLRSEAPVRTGRLRQGLGYNTRESGTSLRISVTSEAPYTDLVIRGRGPVEAKRAKALRFEPGPPGSGFIYRKRVGPAKANPFVARAMSKLGGIEHRTAARISSRITRAWQHR